jgi:hypothetical protein
VGYLPADERDYLLGLARVSEAVETRLAAKNEPSVIRANMSELPDMFKRAEEGRRSRLEEWGSEENSSYESTAEEAFLVLLDTAGLLQYGGETGITLADPPMYG